MSFLWLSVIGPILVWWAAGPQRIHALLLDAKWLTVSAAIGLILIGAHHLLFSQSPDSSYPQSWILASLPMWALAAKLAGAQRLVRWMMIVIAAFALRSAVDFLVTGARAYAPLPDPNNYATLVYLAWIPWTLDRVVGGSMVPARLRSVAVTAAVSFACAIALFATQSRFAILVVVGICLLSVWCFWRFTGSRRDLAAIIIASIVAYVAFVLIGMIHEQTPNVLAEVPMQVVAGDAEDVRLQLLSSAWRAIVESGGINGAGLATFSLLYPSVRALGEQETTGMYVHNDFVQLALEGGVWLLIPMLCLTAVVGFRILRAMIFGRNWMPAFGLLVAVAVALLHAAVNFVLYILPLVIVLGAWLAASFSINEEADGSESIRQLSPGFGWSVWLVVALGLTLNSAYLALDVFTHGVFTGQQHVPYTGQVRGDADAMLRYARLAQKLNGRRAVPILAESRLIDLQHQNSATPLAADQVELAYRKAQQADALNSAVYISRYDYLKRRAGNDLGMMDESAFALLDSAARLDPADLQTTLYRIELALHRQDVAKVREHVEASLQWCELLVRHRPGQFDGWVQHIEPIAQRLNDEAIRAKVSQCHALATRKREGKARAKMWLLRQFEGI